MFQNRFHVFYRRVSTHNQDLTMQIAADASYREKLDEQEMRIINEHGVSANKKSIEERPDMQALLSRIEEDKVSTLYTFDRSRLFRDFYEATKFQDICIRNGVVLCSFGIVPP
ncbi:recombinase family protein [Cytobacillus purgationiresistens]|uniref:Site-specific integrase-resolvase n=1 Tax=Cytobacillus purgationiresistens TaxID=863449 RepID=A0ABU0ATH5_9BACI|nr:recombinase family protein [Cytobacillus purgationiresistens]MDQ0273738.1 putative site-specific integrase-resolvase [Cytobacillus purgationiresistens]